MRSSSCLVVTLGALAFAVPASLWSEEWSPEDTTFDPSVHETVIEGSSRLGDPTPFFKEGVGVQSYTVVEAKPDPNLGAMVNFSLIVPFIPGKTSPQDGGSMFLSIDQAEKLVGFLEDALADPAAEREIGKVFPDGYYQQWTVKTDKEDSSLPVVLEMEMNEEVDRYHFGVNPTKKLIDTLRKRIATATEIASEPQ